MMFKYHPEAIRLVIHESTIILVSPKLALSPKQNPTRRKTAIFILNLQNLQKKKKKDEASFLGV